MHQRNRRKLIIIKARKQKKVDYEYQVGDKVMLNNKSAYKYKTSCKGSYEIIQIWTNGMVTIPMGATIDRISIHQINPYKYEEGACLCHISSTISYIYNYKHTYLYAWKNYIYIQSNIY